MSAAERRIARRENAAELLAQIVDVCPWLAAHLLELTEISASELPMVPALL